MSLALASAHLPTCTLAALKLQFLEGSRYSEVIFNLETMFNMETTMIVASYSILNGGGIEPLSL
jgi:hypothetical protein